MRSRTGNLIQQLPTRSGRLGERGAHVIGRKGNVMDGLAPVLQELLDLRLGVQGRDQLDPAFSNRDHGDLDPLVLEPFPATGPKPKPPLIDLDRLIEIANRDSHVIDPAQHWLILKPLSMPPQSDRLARPTSCAPFVVGLNTASYITGGLPLFTQCSERPAVDGASDPTEGRRLDRDPHRWRNAAPHRWRMRHRRTRPRRVVLVAASVGSGRGRERGAATLWFQRGRFHPR